MNAEAITRALCGHWHGRNGMACCPAHEDRSPSLSLADGEGGRLLVRCFAGCDGRAVLGELRARGLLGDFRGKRDLPRPRPPRKPKPADDDKARIRCALAIWRQGSCPRGTLVERYLAGRWLELDDRASEAVRFHPALRYEGRTTLGMVALLRDVRTDAPCGVHRTFLRPDGTKLDRRMLGRARGAAIKLDPDDEVTLGLAVSEGIETAMAARMLGYRPTWALGSAGAIGNLPVLPGVEGLTILGETDDGGANAQAAQACARRWAAAGCDVEVLEPLVQGDANDVLRARAERG